MQVLRFATREHIESIFRENHELWGRPLGPDEYRDYWFSLFLTAWGSSNFRYMALTEDEDGPLLSSLKLYRFTGNLFGQRIVIAAIGALYTPREQRTFGHASLLMNEVLDYMQKKKAAFAMLYTEIGLPFYERLGFTPLPCFETSGILEARSIADVPGIEIREVEAKDARRLAAYHRELTQGAPLSIDRDPSFWAFLLFRRRRLWELAPSGSGTPFSLVALRNKKVVASGFAVASGERLHLQECTALEGEEKAFGALLDRIWLRSLGAGARTWHGRLAPHSSARDARLAGEIIPAASSIPMVAPLGSTRNLDALVRDPGVHIYGLDAV